MMFIFVYGFDWSRCVNEQTALSRTTLTQRGELDAVHELTFQNKEVQQYILRAAELSRKQVTKEKTKRDLLTEKKLSSHSTSLE